MSRTLVDNASGKTLVDPTTGKELVGIGECACGDAGAYKCSLCFSGADGLYLQVVISGVRKCSDGELYDFNGAHCLTRHVGQPCVWTTVTDDGYTVRVITSAGVTVVDIYMLTTFLFTASSEDACDWRTYNNDYEGGDCGGQVVGYGGSVTVSDPCA